MWTMEDVLSEGEIDGKANSNNSIKRRNNGGLAPGFRFHPTDEELITFYLASKVFCNHTFATPIHIAEVDLNRCEPWDLPERAKMGEKEWYLYSLKDRKYPTGLRTNRATGSGYWKATGKDRQIFASMGTGTGGEGSSGNGMLIGMKKTLVFYQSRAPRGVKTRWVMHEYRLDGHFSSFRLSSKEEWVICRIFHKHGGEKKPTPYHHPSPLSPFLRCLPPLLDHHIPTTTSSSSSTTPSLQTSSNNNNNKPNNNNYPHYNNNNNNSNFLLQSLLSNPLPNFSSLTDEPTVIRLDTISGPMTTTTTIDQQPYPVLLNPFCNPIPEGVCENGNVEEYENYCMTKNCHVQTNVDGDVTVGGLDGLLNPNHINFSAESWPFHA